MAEAGCLICKKRFYAKPSHLERGWAKYCSMGCRTRSQFKGTLLSCFQCGKEVYRIPAQIRKAKSGKSFCGKSCQTIWRNSALYFGENHANWKGGEHTYRNILTRNNIKQVCTRCNLRDPRVLSAHHVDRNRKNNRIENLRWLCQNCHYLIHHDIVEMRKFMEILV